MSLAKLLESLELDLNRNLPRNTTSFADARARQPEIAPFQTVSALLDALRPSSSLPIRERRALIAALLREAQTSRSSFAPGALTLSCAPMLHRLRKRASKQRENPDLDGDILIAFTTAIRVVPPTPFALLALRWATQRTIFSARRAERGIVVAESFDEDLHTDSAIHRGHARELLIDAVRSLERAGNAEILDVFLATRQEEESLRDYVARTCPDVHERRARYEHLYRARRQFERDLRKRLTRRAPRPVRPHDYRVMPFTETRNQRIDP